MTDLAKLVVRLEAQSAQLLAELDKANRKIEKFASATSKALRKWSAGLLSFFSARFLINFGKQVLQVEGELVGMAERAGTTVDRLSGLGFAADQSASSLEGLTKGLGNLADRSADAAEKGGAAAAAFKKIGVEVENQDGTLKNSADLLLEIATEFAKYEDGAAKSALATDLFGKQGKELIPLLNRGAAGIEELTKQAEKLGITVGQDAAEAANEFNDQLNTLGAITRGIVGKALAEVLPILIEFNDSLINSEDAAGRAEKASRILATGLKLLLSAGTIIGEVFDRIGETIGAVAAAVVAAAEGDFRRAWEIIKEGAASTAESGAETADELYRIWTSTADGIAKSAEDADARVKKTVLFGGKADAVQEIRISAKKIEDSPVAALEKELLEMTKTQEQLALASYFKQKEALDYVWQVGGIANIEDYNARLQEIQDELLPEFDVTVKKLKDSTKAATDELTKFQERAIENIQDILATGLETALEDGIDKGADAALVSFGDMLQKMALQAIAADIGQYLFGKPGESGDDGGLLGAGLKAIGSYLGFGGARDTGGRGYPGMAYSIGTGAQPERFVPDSPGTFVPAGDDMAALTVHNTFLLPPGGQISRQTQGQIAAAAARSVAQANRRNN